MLWFFGGGEEGRIVVMGVRSTGRWAGGARAGSCWTCDDLFPISSKSFVCAPLPLLFAIIPVPWATANANQAKWVSPRASVWGTHQGYASNNVHTYPIPPVQRSTGARLRCSSQNPVHTPRTSAFCKARQIHPAPAAASSNNHVAACPVSSPLSAPPLSPPPPPLSTPRPPLAPPRCHLPFP